MILGYFSLLLQAKFNDGRGYRIVWRSPCMEQKLIDATKFISGVSPACVSLHVSNFYRAGIANPL